MDELARTLSPKLRGLTLRRIQRERKKKDEGKAGTPESGHAKDVRREVGSIFAGREDVPPAWTIRRVNR